MTRFRYYHDSKAGTVELAGVSHYSAHEFRKMFPEGTPAKRSQGGYFVGYDPKNSKVRLPATRVIEYKRNASGHQCDARCMNGAVNGKCECACGGKNHGVGTARKAFTVSLI